MATSSSLLWSTVVFASYFGGYAVAQNVSSHEGCIHLPVIHSTNVNYFAKRAVEVPLANRSDVAYYAQLNFGTPPQPQFVQLDTGSFELWVNPDCSTLGNSDARFCQGVGHYDSSQSSTAASLGTTKTLQYGIGSANITYFTDSIGLAGSSMTMTNVQFGVATSTESEFAGILGIGYGEGITTRYKNFVDELSAQNVTKVKAYTLALGSKDSQEGVIVFGGVDTSKFAGSLAKLPIIPAADSPDQVPRFWVDMDSLTLTPPSGVSSTYSNSSIPVFLDSGSTMTLLPPDLTAAIAADFGATAPDSSGFYEVSCDLTSLSGTLDFAFNGTTIKVPYNELIRTVASSPPTCFLGISPSSSFTLLGDTFLRSAYVVFDLESNVVWMTQATDCGSTPAALANVAVLGSVKGACTLTNDGAASSSTSTSTAASAATAAPTSGTSTSPSASTTAGAASASSAGVTATGGRGSKLGLATAFLVALCFLW